MTVATRFQSWNRGLEPGAPYDGASPNLQALATYCHARWKLAGSRSRPGKATTGSTSKPPEKHGQTRHQSVRGS